MSAIPPFGPLPVRRIIRWAKTRTDDATGFVVGVGFALPVQVYAAYLRADDGEWTINGKRLTFWMRRSRDREGVVFFAGPYRFSLWVSKRQPNAPSDRMAGASVGGPK